MTQSPITDSAARFVGAHRAALGATTRLKLLAQAGRGLAVGRRQALATNLSAELQRLLTDHHQDEEQSLFPAMLSCARHTGDSDIVSAMTGRLVREHRAIELALDRIWPQLASLINGEDVTVPADLSIALAQRYAAHVRFEELVVLPLAATLLGAADSKPPDMAYALRHDLSGLSRYV